MGANPLTVHGDRTLDATVVPMALTRSLSMPDKDRFEDCDFDNDHDGLITQAWERPEAFAVVTMTHVHLQKKTRRDLRDVEQPHHVA